MPNAHVKGTGQSAPADQAIIPYEGSRFLPLVMGTNEVREIIGQALGPEGLNPRDLQRIKLPAGGGTTWAVQTVDGEVPTQTIAAVILAHRQVRVYWASEYTGERNPPDCYSDDAVQGIGNPGVACDTCPNSQWGSAERGKGQACQLRRVLFFLPEGSLLPSYIALPPTSEGVAKQYITGLAAVGLLPWEVITEIKLERARNDRGIDYSRVVFRRAATLTAPDRVTMRAAAAEIRPAILKTRIAAADIEGLVDTTDATGREAPDAAVYQEGHAAEVAI